MRFPYHYILLSICVLSGCSLPDQPHPKDVVRYSYALSTPLALFLPTEYLTYDAYFEAMVMKHTDSSESTFENTALFINRLGDSYLPENPVTISVNGKYLFDTAQYHLSFSNSDSVDYTQPLVWQVIGGAKVPSFIDTLVSPQKVNIVFPPPDSVTMLPKQPFTVKYDVSELDSIYVRIYVFTTDSASFYIREFAKHVSNTGSYFVGSEIVDYLPMDAAMQISVAAIKQKEIILNDMRYLLRTGLIDNTHVHFIN